MDDKRNEDVIFKTILRCLKNIDKPDLHSFTIRVPGGLAYIEAEYGGGVFVDVNTGHCEHRFYNGTPMAAANYLEMIGADPKTISS